MKDYCSSLEAMFYAQGNKSIIFQSSLSRPIIGDLFTF